MKTPPAIGSKVILSPKAHAKLDASPGRSRARNVVGEVVGLSNRRVLVRWPDGSTEAIGPGNLEMAP